jgi:hypothetical protein
MKPVGVVKICYRDKEICVKSEWTELVCVYDKISIKSVKADFMNLFEIYAL